MQTKNIIKIVVAAAIVIPTIASVVYYSMNIQNIPFESVCVSGNSKYTDLCKNVGKRAHSIKRMLAVNDTDYGKIVGVAWRQRGSFISSPGQERRVSESNSYYYIIGADKNNYYFLRITSEIEPKAE